MNKDETFEDFVERMGSDNSNLVIKNGFVWKSAVEIEQRIYIECDCHHPEHLVSIKYEDEDDSVSLYVHLKKYGFFKRLWRGIRYILGYQSRYGAYDEFIIPKPGADMMIEELKKIEGKFRK